MVFQENIQIPLANYLKQLYHLSVIEGFFFATIAMANFPDHSSYYVITR